MKIILCAYREWALESCEIIMDILPIENYVIVKNQKSLEKQIDDLDPDLLFFLGWSWIVPKEIINKYYCICLHPSPLPKYRGGSPLQHQIINGENDSAVTFFKMTEGLDKGPIVSQTPFSLDGSLKGILNRIKKISYQGVLQLIQEFKYDKIIETPQIESDATYFKRRTPEMSEIKFSDFTIFDVKKWYNKIRALSDPYPNAYIKCRGKKLYLKEASLNE